MANRCGDPASLQINVKQPLVGKVGVVAIKRQFDDDIAGSHSEEIKQAGKKVFKWPDLDDGQGGYFGGRKADYKGLDKLDYAGKFGKQSFKIEFSVGGKKAKASDKLKIRNYAKAGPEHKQIGIPMPTAKWAEQWQTVAGASQLVPVRVFHDPAGTNFKSGANAGNFHIGFKNGWVILEVKIELSSQAPGWNPALEAKVFKSIKQRSEAFWNLSGAGFAKWDYHRKDCARKDDCDCPVIMNRAGDYTQAGCCKVPVQVRVTKGSDNQVDIRMLTPTQRLRFAVGGVIGYGLLGWPKDAQGHGITMNTLSFVYPENRPNTYAHEIGHMIGFPDQYWNGVTEDGAIDPNGVAVPGVKFPVDNDSIMGGGQLMAKETHIKADWIHSWINSKVDTMEPVVR